MGQDEDSSRRYSEQTSREIDTEVKRIIDEAIEQVRHILDVRYDALIAVTTRLIEVESIGAKELREIIEKTSPGPVIVPGTDATVDPAPSQRPVDNRSRTEQSG
jgi:cell division protease FtsH